MKVTTVIRECTWIGDVPVKWQGHAYTEDRPMAEPIISGMPANSAIKARKELEKAIEEYLDLGIKAKAATMKKNKVSNNS